MGRVQFNLTLHFHQPVGNFDSVIERAYAKCYLPFFEHLHRHSRVKATLHFSGCLLEWIEIHHPEFFDLLREMTKRGQVEFLTGGFNEPILAAIPDWDVQGQVRMLTEYLQEKFGATAEGAWLTERVWEPGIASKLADAGVKFTVLDDTIFQYSGVTRENMWGYYITEDQRKPLAIFPSAQQLRYCIPFLEPQATEAFLDTYATDWNDRLVVYGDDGEKFGEWPDTHEWVYTKGWLERFFIHLENLEQVETTHLGDYLHRQSPRDRIYLPTASYEEMLGWALPAAAGQQYTALREQFEKDGVLQQYEPYFHGGAWRDFLAKYPESNHLQKRVFYLSEAYHAAEAQSAAPETKNIATADPKLLAEGKQALWRAQCNCGYWHGVFGGLYLAHIRGASYHHLNKAEEYLQRAEGRADGWISAQQIDINVDGRPEVMTNAAHGTTIWTPHYGGSLREWSLRPPHVNVLNALTRRTEAYHEQVRQAAQQQEETAGDAAKSIHDGMRLKAEGLDEKLFTDWYLRGGLVDHLLGADATFEGFQRCQYPEFGDFVNQPYTATVVEESDTITIRMARDGLMAEQPLRIEKIITLNAAHPDLLVRYRFHNPLDFERDVWYGCETTFLLPNCAGFGVYYQCGNKDQWDLQIPGAREQQGRICAVDEQAGIALAVQCGEPFDVWTFPVESVSLSEGGAELTFQGSSVMPHWRFTLPPNGMKQLELTWRMEQI